uniref:protein-tyrosine-phosphatase n=1 Tax=Compsopogon caeruleus TaxID=31354 RepID=A0A7S1XEM9_9RHOD|mmetsp:Transcript_17839/g.37047  ORF Transcript_17839/g.37047 Transcript_17839/m.37047 type:complete len:261 (+) Transcript_17839:371-1153(+)
MRATGWVTDTADDGITFEEGTPEKRALSQVQVILEGTAEKNLVDRHGPWRLLNHIVLGDLFHAMDVVLLRRVGVTHVLNLSPQTVKTSKSHYAASRLPVEYKAVWAEDSMDYDILRDLRECHSFLDRGRKSGGIVLVHCHAGVNRSVSVLISYLMVTLQRSLAEVVQYVYEIRGIILTNSKFVEQLVLFASFNDLLQSPDRRESSKRKPGRPVYRDSQGRIIPMDESEEEEETHKLIAASGLLVDVESPVYPSQVEGYSV